MRFPSTLPFLMAPLALSAQGSAVAMVMDQKGDIQVTSGPLPPAKLGTLAELKAGDKVVLGKDARMVWVTFQGGQQLTLQGPATLVVGADGRPQGAPPGLQAKDVKALHLKDGLKPGGLAQASLVMRGPTDDFTLTSPAAPVVLAVEAFAWEDQGTGTTYTLVVRQEHGPSCLEATTTERRVPVPPGKLVPGQAYTWTVKALAPAGTTTESAGRVEILSAGRRAVLDAAKPGPKADFAARVLYAVLLEQYQLTDLAKAQWKALARERKGDDVLEGYAQ